MARNTANITITDDTRDKGKVYVLTEMPSAKSESWAARAIMAMIKSGIQLPPGFDRLGMAGLAEVGLQSISGLKWEDAEPLLKEMLDCVQIMPDPTKPHVVRALMVDDDIEELSTRIKLRAEVWKLHVGFLKAVAPQSPRNWQRPNKSPRRLSKRPARNWYAARQAPVHAA